MVLQAHNAENQAKTFRDFFPMTLIHSMCICAPGWEVLPLWQIVAQASQRFILRCRVVFTGGHDGENHGRWPCEQQAPLLSRSQLPSAQNGAGPSHCHPPLSTGVRDDDGNTGRDQRHDPTGAGAVPNGAQGPQVPTGYVVRVGTVLSSSRFTCCLLGHFSLRPCE